MNKSLAESAFEGFVESFSHQYMPERTFNKKEKDSDDEIEIVAELETSLAPHQCDLCCEGTFLVNKLLKFGGVINDSQKHACDICCKGFLKKSDLSKHVKLHETGELNSDAEVETDTTVSSNEHTVVCMVCALPCKSLRGLHKHMNSRHKGEASNVHVCERCSATFTNFRLFTRHCLLHMASKKKMFTCASCKKKFLWKRSLKEHVCLLE